MGRNTIETFKLAKGGKPIVCLTSYSASMTRSIDPHVDMILVGDSLGMVLYGMESTLPVTVDMMVNHGRAVVKASENALVVVDMPFGSYQESPEQAFSNAAHILKETGCAAVKLEGGTEMVPTVSFLTQRGIPVLGHIGLQPQSVNALGGYRMTGKSQNEKAHILNSAKQLEEAGAFGIVLECVIGSLALDITAHISIPTIGIGASVGCDGQILVTDDILGLTGDYVPGFAKVYDDISKRVDVAVSSYANDVRTRLFPVAKKGSSVASKDRSVVGDKKVSGISS